MLPSEFDRRYLSSNQHNRVSSPHASPVKLHSSTNSPLTTPTKRGDHGDRYIPLRQPAGDLITRFSALPSSDGDSATPSTIRPIMSGSSRGNTVPVHTSNNAYPASPYATTPASHNAQGNPSSTGGNSGEEGRTEQIVMKALLRNELLRHRIDDIRSYKADSDVCPSLESRNRDLNGGGLFTYGQRTPTRLSRHGDASTSSPSLFGGPLTEDSLRLLKSPRKPQRKVPKNPYKVLDAPELQDDFYLNLVDWSSQNMLSVGLNACVYLWSACNSQVIKLCDLSGESDTVTSVQWTEKGDLLAVGTNKGITQIWDVHAQKKLHELAGHSSRIGCLAWNGELVCSGSRDRHILQRDIRVQGFAERKLSAHRQEVCGLKWSPDRQYLASGGNDNQLLVWSLRRPEPCQTYTDCEHNAAVKALAWSPHHHGLLVSGGGTADRCLRFWNTLTGQPMQCVDTGSQVCNVAWSKHSPELVSTHGYSYNQVVIWKYPSLQPVTKLTGHQTRVLYLAMSPDGESIVTGAGDETLRFWHVFCKAGQPRSARSKLNLFTSLR